MDSIAHSPVAYRKNELFLKLFFSRNQDVQETLNHLEAYCEKLAERLNTYRGIQEMIQTQLMEQPNAPFWLITLDYGLRTTQAAMDWAACHLKTSSNCRLLSWFNIGIPKKSCTLIQKDKNICLPGKPSIKKQETATLSASIMKPTLSLLANRNRFM